MTTNPRARVRCAIYTRVSTDAGLDQDFNSLDAQYEGASAYIRSQAHAGWTLLRKRYDDGGFSGGSTDRPALQQLLDDIRARKIDIIVVYKVDRLTRSLADFAKLVELFDAHSVSFVSVTQQFNTTTSMGRLTLNVLLSFAQFEREVTSERIRDKIAASKRKGLWVGGMVPLGYQAKDRKIRVVETEARTVRHIFRRYLELGSLKLLLADLEASGITTKVRPLATGRTIGGIPFTRGPLAHFLRNRFYVGEVTFKGEILPGEQPAIVDRDLFDAVQAKLDQQRTNWTTSRSATDSILSGLIYDDAGNRMTPSYTMKKGVRYRYYISSPLVRTGATKAGKINRVPADEIERLVVTAFRKLTVEGVDEPRGRASAVAGPPSDALDDREAIRARVRRVDMDPKEIVVQLAAFQNGSPASNRQRGVRIHAGKRDLVIRVPWSKRPSKAPRQIIRNIDPLRATDHRPIRAETRARLVDAIATGRRWLEELLAGNVTEIGQIAARERCSVRQVNMTLSLAFLSPFIVNAAVEGRLPRGIGIARIRDCPTLWSLQHDAVGLAFEPPRRRI